MPEKSTILENPAAAHDIQKLPAGDESTSKTKERLPTVLSLFCGCGGLDLGFEQQEYEVGLAYDMRSAAVQSHNNARSSNRAFVRDVSKLTLDILDADHGSLFAPNGVIGGPPCQSFSRGNVSKSEDDPRRLMVANFFNVSLLLHRRCQLDFIVMENVTEVERADDGELLAKEVRRLEAAGFSVNTAVYNSVEYGVAQSRRRLILVAINRKKRSRAWEPPPPSLKKQTVADAIAGLPEPTHFAKSKEVTAFPTHPNHWCMTPKSKKFFDGSLRTGRSTGRSFKTLSWDKPSYTVSYGHREVHVHPNCHRRLSVYEAMLLQGFPTDFVLTGTMSDQFSQVSEAVPPPLANAIAASVKKALYTTPKNCLSNSCSASAV